MTPMRRFADLHTHSNASDGQLPPEELIRLAERSRLAAVALTDHDTTEGLAAARHEAGKFPELHFVPGIEISARFPRGTLHILGLGIGETSAALQHLAARLREDRRTRNPKILARLQAIGAAIDMDDVLAAAGPRPGKIIGRLHIAEALRRKGYVRTTGEAFEKYIGDGKPAFIDKERLEPREAIAAILAAGGLAALAHPVQLNYDNRAQLERVLKSMIRHGLNAIEVYHTDHTPAQTRTYLDLAKRYELCVVGGSDFHGCTAGRD